MENVGRAVGFIGYSKTGKTTVVCAVIGRLVARGRTVAYVKHTDHTADGIRAGGGDTGRALAAGAASATIAFDESAVIFSAAGKQPETRGYEDPRELLNAGADIIVVEGFKSLQLWPRILLCRNAAEFAEFDASTLAAVVCDEELETSLPTFRRDDVETLTTFVDRISNG